MALATEALPIQNVIIVYLSSIGGLAGIIICMVLLINVSIHICKTNNLKQRITYILVILLFISSIVSCIGYAFLRSNIIINFKSDYISNNHCVMGYFVSFIFWLISRVFLYTIFLYRIQNVFRESAYDYHPCVYKFGYPWFCLYTFTVSAFNIWSAIFSNARKSILGYNEDTNTIFCWYSFQDQTALKYLLYLGTVTELLTNIVLLYLFIKGLYSLRNSILDSKHKSSTNILNNNCMNNDEPIYCKSKSKIFQDTMTEYENDKESVSITMQLLIKLHLLMKKQTILVIYANVSTLIFYLISVLIPRSSILFPLDISANCICVWLMLGTSEKYWICCTKYGLCCCCFGINKNKDYESKNKNHQDKKNFDHNQKPGKSAIIQTMDNYDLSELQMRKAHIVKSTSDPENEDSEVNLPSVDRYVSTRL